MSDTNEAQGQAKQQPITSMLMSTVPYWNSQSQAFYYELSFVTNDRKTRITPEHTAEVLGRYLVQSQLDKYVGPESWCRYQCSVHLDFHGFPP